MILQVLGIPKDFKIIFINGSGTAGMEFSLNCVPNDTKLISVESGLFGQRTSQIAEKFYKTFERKEVNIALSTKQNLLSFKLNTKKNEFVHLTSCDTSTGYLLDIAEIKSALNPETYLMVDGVTGVFTEAIPFELIDLIYFASHKGLACEPGLSFAVLSPRMQQIIRNGKSGGFYLNPENYLRNIERFQTPFTPPIGIINQVKKRLQSINQEGGLEKYILNIKFRAQNFRTFISDFDCAISTPYSSNCVTSFRPPKNINSFDLVEKLKEKGIFITPNSASCMPEYVRIAHFGDQKKSDYKKLYKYLQKAFNA